MAIYVSIAIVASIGSWLFLWWLYKNKFRASSVYLYVTFMIVGEAIRGWINVHGRELALADDGSFLPFTLTWPWALRSVLGLVGLTAIVVHMLYRILTGRDPNIVEFWGDKIQKIVGCCKLIAEYSSKLTKR
jgi:hypothetical protein